MEKIIGHPSQLNSPRSFFFGTPQEKTDAQVAAAHKVICRLVCCQWRDCVPPPPQGFQFWFAPSLATHGSVSLMKWTKEMILPQAWDGVTCCKKAADGGHLELLRWLKNEGDDGWNSARISAQRGDEEMLRCGCWRKVI